MTFRLWRWFFYIVVLLSFVFVCLFALPSVDKKQSLAGFWDASSRLPDPLDRSKASDCHRMSHLLMWDCTHLLHNQHGKIGHHVVLAIAWPLCWDRCSKLSSLFLTFYVDFFSQSLPWVAFTYGFIGSFGQCIALIPTMHLTMAWFPNNKVICALVNLSNYH